MQANNVPSVNTFFGIGGLDLTHAEPFGLVDWTSPTITEGNLARLAACWVVCGLDGTYRYNRYSATGERSTSAPQVALVAGDTRRPRRSGDE